MSPARRVSAPAGIECANSVTLTAGSRLGPFEIQSAIGAGGMGEVYRARDAKLNRDVALKVLPEAFAADPERLARFQREAQLLATLNHPHIGAIYGLEESNGTTALVLELIEGPTLADRLATSAVPLDEALVIARQIADALEAAHEKGVVHRDLKPANIKITPDGKVKVLDFGLAKALDPVDGPAKAGHYVHRRGADDRDVRSVRLQADLTNSPTMRSPAMTGVGIILGTAAYMSPEQARGKPADRRADVWAFSCVLYEMLTGRQTFEAGETVSDAIAAILTREPDWAALPADVPARIRTLLRRCLQKDPRKRLRDIGDARLEIEDGGASSDPSPVPKVDLPTHGRRRLIAVGVVTLLAGASVGALALWMLTRAPDAKLQPIRFTIALAAPESLSAAAPAGIVVVLNWVEELRQRLPVK
jgi:eukaryotic-like serine/threonine-protein kinase